jgi:hypothetical protein
MKGSFSSALRGRAVHRALAKQPYSTFSGILATDISGRASWLKLVRILFFAQGGLKQMNEGRQMELLREVSSRDVAGHLVMLDLLRRPDECQVGGGFALFLALRHDFLTLLDDSHQTLSRLRMSLDIEEGEALVDPLDLSLGSGCELRTRSLSPASNQRASECSGRLGILHTAEKHARGVLQPSTCVQCPTE